MRRIFVIALLAIFATIIIVATASMFSEDFRAQMTDILGVPGEMIAEQMISFSTWASTSATNSTIQAVIWSGTGILLGTAAVLLWRRRPGFLRSGQARPQQQYMGPPTMSGPTSIPTTTKTVTTQQSTTNPAAEEEKSKA
jgi:hypothetical protein